MKNKILSYLNNSFRAFGFFDKDVDLTVHTKIIGIVRTCLVLNLFTNLAFTKNFVFFPATVRIDAIFFGIPNFFQVFGTSNTTIIFVCLFLVFVIVGYLPQLTGIIHAWIATSFFMSARLVEGGDQIAQILTILLIPVTLTDKRINHWHSKDYFGYHQPEVVQFFSFSCLLIIRLQIAIVYLFSAAVKISKDFWIDGTAIYYWFVHIPFGLVSPLDTLLYPFISNTYFCAFLTWGVLVLEFTLFAALFSRYSQRPLLFVLAISFHIMIIIVHGLWAFFFAMLAGLIVYLLPWNNSQKQAMYGELKMNNY